MFAQNMLKYAYSYTPCANYYLTLLVLFIWNNTNVYILIYRLIFALSFSLTYTRISITKFVIPMPPKNEVFVYSFAFFFSLSLLYYWWCCWCYYVCYHIRWLVRSVALESHKEKQGKELVTSFLIYTWQQQHQQKTNRKRLHKITLLHKCKPMEETKRLGKQMPIKSLSSNRGNNNNDNKKPSHLFCVDSLTNNEESIAMDQQNDSMIILSRNKKKCATIYDFHHGLRYIYIYLMCVFSRLCVLFFSLFFYASAWNNETHSTSDGTPYRMKWRKKNRKRRRRTLFDEINRILSTFLGWPYVWQTKIRIGIQCDS